MMGFNSFFRFLFVVFPLEAFATCFALLIAACLMCEPFMVEGGNGGCCACLVGWRGGGVSVCAAGAWEQKQWLLMMLLDAMLDAKFT